MLVDLPLISLTMWLPILGGIWVLASGNDTYARPMALIVSLLTFALSLFFYFGFDTTTPAMQFTERWAWIPSLGIYYHFGIDGISMPLILLTTLTTILVVLAGWEVIQYKAAQYFAAFLMLVIMIFSFLKITEI